MKKKTVMIAVRISAREAEQLAAMINDERNSSDVIRQALAALYAAEMTCKTCRFCRYNQARRYYTCSAQGGYRLPDLGGCKKWEAKR